MARMILGVIVGLVVWTVVVTGIDICLRHTLPGYTAAEPALAFTLGMKLARLAMAAVTSLVAGTAVRAIAPDSRWAPWITGLVILALFLPAHIHIGLRQPLWYHLFFLGTLAPLVAVGAWGFTRLRGQPGVDHAPA